MTAGTPSRVRRRTNPLGISCLFLFASFGCASTTPTGPEPGSISALCTDVRRRGLYNQETLAANPELSKLVYETACRIYPANRKALGLMGFGEGFEIYGTRIEWDWELVSDSDLDRASNWARNNCTGDWRGAWRSYRLAIEEALARDTDPRAVLVDLWQPVWDRTPVEIVMPWQWCRSDGHLETEGGRIGCNAYAEHREDGLVVFELADFEASEINLFPFPQYLFGGARLQEDLRVTGAKCPGLWRKGKKIRPYRQYRLECERSGRSAVQIGATTKDSACRATFPAID